MTAEAASGLFTFSYTGTTLAECTYDFTGTATVGPLTSDPSADFLVVVDRTPPAVTLTAPAQTTSLGPQVRITASDRNGLPNTTTFALDVNSTSNYATGTLTNGTALLTLPALPATGTYTLDARVLDLAGNQGTSPTATVTVNAVTSGWAFTAQVLSADPRQGDALDQLGDVSVEHALDLDQSPDTSQGGDPALVYNSDSVQLHPVVQLTVPTPNNAALPASLGGTLVWDYGGTTPVTTPFLVSTAGASPGATLTLAVENMNVATTTGRHVWQVQLGTPAGTSTTLGYAFVVNEESSPFGAGWTFAGTDQLVSVAADAYGDPAGVLRVYGTGEWRFYPGTTSFTSPAGDNGTLSLSGGTYTYTTPDGQTETFNSSGDQTQWASADGQETLQYRYNGSNQLTGMTAIDGALSTFSYSGGLLSTISTVNGRTTSFAYSGTDLTQVTNPDGGVHTFAYVSNHRLTGETFANLQNEYAYTDDRAAQETWGSATGPGGQTNGSISHLSPAAVQGLSTAVAGTVYAQSTDPDGYTTLSQRDAQGRLLQQVAANGGVTQDAYSNGFLTSTTDALGRTTSYALDSSAYVTQVTNPDGTVATYQYQSAFHALTQSTDERGASTTYAMVLGRDIILALPLREGQQWVVQEIFRTFFLWPSGWASRLCSWCCPSPSLARTGMSSVRSVRLLLDEGRAEPFIDLPLERRPLVVVPIDRAR